MTGEADISLWREGPRPILRLIRAVGSACRREPLLNSSFDDDAMTLVAADVVNLGIAMDSRDGLFVPVLRDINARPLDVLAGDVARLRDRVASRKISPAEMHNATITLSNFGAVGGLHAEMIVVPPQVAIVGAGRAFERASVSGAGVTRWLPLSVTFDHRVVTGVEACRFLRALTENLELTE